MAAVWSSESWEAVAGQLPYGLTSIPPAASGFTLASFTASSGPAVPSTTALGWPEWKT
jgi:hypothetical protein